MTDLTERYLDAIRRDLPRAEADTIMDAETRSLQDRIAEKEKVLGHDLGEDELADLIGQCPHPRLVSARYRPGRHLIGPETFPVFAATLLSVTIAIAAIVILATLAAALAGARGQLPAILGHGLGNGVLALVNGASLTIIFFAILERCGFPGKALERWQPRDLPPVGAAHDPAWLPAVVIGLCLALFVCWTGLYRIALDGHAGGALRIEAHPALAHFTWPILFLILTPVAAYALAWAAPRRLVARLVLNGTMLALGYGIFALLFRQPTWLRISGEGVDPAHIAAVERAFNGAIGAGLLAASAIWTIALAIATYRILMRLKAARSAVSSPGAPVPSASLPSAP